MRFLAALLAFLLLAPPAGAVITIDSQEPSAAAHECTSTCSSLSYTFTNTAGTLLICGESFVGTTATTGLAAGTATYNGVSMSVIGSAFTFAQGAGEAAIVFWKLANPATGGNTVAFTPTFGANTAWSVNGACMSLTGASGSFGTLFTFNATVAQTTESVSVTGTVNGSLVLSTSCTGTAFSTAISPTVLSASHTDANTGCSCIAFGDQTTAGGAVSAGFNTTSDLGGIAALEVFAAAAGARERMLMGVGQ